MNSKVHMSAVTADREASIVVAGLVALTAAALVMTSAAALAGSSGSAKPIGAVKFENVQGSKVKRIILTPKAAQRLGIETGTVGQAIIERKQMVGGVVVATTRKLPMVGNGPANRGPRAIRSSFGGGFARPVVGSSRQSASSRAIGSAGHPQRWIRVRLSERELARATPDLPVRVLPFGSTRSVMAYPSKLAPVADLQRDMMWLHYSLRGTGHGLKLRQRVRVEMLLSDTGKRRKVIPYSAVFYDKKGVSWTYVTRAPLQYMRERIRIDHIAGDLAVLSDGPALGTKIVTKGAAMLHGTEVYGN